MAESEDRGSATGLAGAPGVRFWQDVEEAFSAVLAAGDAARTASLAQHCGASTAVRAEVEALLAAHTRAGEFITPITTDGGDRPDAPHAEPNGLAHSQAGAFRLLDCIGEGGMGAVYRAERVDGDFTQHVAVKLIASRLYGADTLRRFRAERQILASLQHPNIVALLDGGVTTAGQPYIAMEYVQGLPITAFCRQHGLSLGERLRLFCQLCAAVSFAHRHLVVHRDLKPANVLVTPDGTVKVLDFGVAKLLDAPGLAAEVTGTLLGPLTPDFASPEQFKGAAITTASDVYALGVMLYELVAGARPYLTAGKPLDELMALVLHHEPPRPSAVRGAGVPYDPRRLRGDMDAIVLKAMAKDPERRYASADELATEIGRHLDGLPVSARPRSLRYLLGKLVARHKAAFTVAAVSLSLLVVALAAALSQARVAAHERERALRRFNDVRQLAGAMIFKLHDEIAPLAGSTPARRMVIAEGLKFLEGLQQDAEGDAVLQLELARAYLRIGDVLGDRSEANLGDYEGAYRAHQKARDLLRPSATSPGPSAETMLVWIEAHLRVVKTEPGGEHDAQEAALTRTGFEAARAWCARAPTDERAQELLAKAHMHMASIVGHPDSLPHWQAAERLYDAVLASAPGDARKQRNASMGQKYLGGYYETSHDFEAAMPHYRRAYELDLLRLRSAPDDKRAKLAVAIDIANIAGAHEAAGDYAQAITGYAESLDIRRRLSEADPQDVRIRGRVAAMHCSLASAYCRAARLGPARQHALSALEIFGSLGEKAGQAQAFIALAEIETADHKPRAACAAYVRAQRLFAASAAAGLPSRSPDVAQVERQVAACTRR